MFSRQADRWWEFRKWQIDNRGLTIEDDGFSVYVTAQKRRRSLSRSHDISFNSIYEETFKRMWMMKLKFFEICGNGGFPTYEAAVKKRLASHKFTRAFELKDDPCRQGVWETWIEYLNFEYWEADRLAAFLQPSEAGYRNAWNDFLRFNVSGSSSPREMTVFNSKISSAEIASLEERLATTQAELESFKRKISCFIQKTKVHRDREEVLRCQFIRTQWIREQLQLIETETAEKNKMVHNDQAQPILKKRKRAEEEELNNNSIKRSFKKSRRHSLVNQQTNINNESQSQGAGRRSHVTLERSTTSALRRSQRLLSRRQICSSTVRL